MKSFTAKEKTKVEDEISVILMKESLFVVKGIDHVNYKPHPFTIGPKNIGNFHVNLEAGCAVPKCQLSFEEHVYDTVLFVALTRNASNGEATRELFAIKQILEREDIDGIGFVETTEKYRIE